MNEHDALRAQLTQELAAAQLEHAARQFVAVSAQVVTGDSTQAQLRARRTDLQAMALTFALAPGWTPPAYAQACPAPGAE